MATVAAAMTARSVEEGAADARFRATAGRRSAVTVIRSDYIADDFAWQ